MVKTNKIGVAVDSEDINSTLNKAALIEVISYDVFKGSHG